MMTEIVIREYEGTQVFFQSDAYLNATEIAQRFGKNPKDYLKTSRTQEYINAVGRKILTEQNQLVIVRQGGTPQEQGTWLHPKLAIDFARWLNTDFAVWCDEQIENILRGESLAGPADNLDMLRSLNRQAGIILDELSLHREKIRQHDSHLHHHDVEIARLRILTNGKRPTKISTDQIGLDLDKSALPKPKSVPVGTHASPRPHDRRGHYRNCPSGKRIWVRDTTVGGSIH